MWSCDWHLKGAGLKLMALLKVLRLIATHVITVVRIFLSLKRPVWRSVSARSGLPRTAARNLICWGAHAESLHPPLVFTSQGMAGWLVQYVVPCIVMQTSRSEYVTLFSHVINVTEGKLTFEARKKKSHFFFGWEQHFHIDFIFNSAPLYQVK